SSPRLLCTATKQKNNGQNLEEDVGQNEQKTDLPSAEKTLMEEKAKLEEQLKETMVRLRALVGSVVFRTPGEDYSVGPFKLVLGKDKGGGQRYGHVVLS
ncbi:GrpE protein 1, mitochondrial, partial [Eschrichtius robustus]|nr:GrpE protein 1, mitochondrial [Eschrichtius robustus]